MIIILKLIIGFGLLNVWLRRFNISTPYRGGNAQNMHEEFKNYGLPVNFMYLIGSFKVILAVILILSIFLNLSKIVYLGVLMLAFVMVGSILMHLKIKDPIEKSGPAILMLLMSVALLFLIG